MGFSVGGGSKEKGFVSERTPQFEDWAASSIANRAGIKKVVNPEYTAWQNAQSQPQQPQSPYGRPMAGAGPRAPKPWESGGAGGYQQQQKAPEQYSYDLSGGGQVGKGQATAPYSKDLSLLGKANQGFQNPYQFKETYNPYQFDYKGLPQQYGDLAYNSGSQSIRRQGEGDLQKIQESVGVRRPGLLLKAGQQNQRNVAEQLSKMRSDIDLDVMRQNVDLGKSQQQDQAGQQQAAYQSRADREGRQSDEGYRYLQGLQSGAASKIGLESQITESERAYQDKIYDYLMQLYSTAAGGKTSSSGKSFGVNAG